MLQSNPAARKRSARFSLAVISSNVVLNTLVAGVVSFVPLSASAATTLLSDGFGVGGTDSSFNEAPVWTEDNAGAEKRAIGGGNDTASPNGGRFAVIFGDNGELCLTVNAEDYEDVALSYYWRGDEDAEASDDGIVEVRATGPGVDCGSNSNGIGWTQIGDHNLSNDGSWTTVSAITNSVMNDKQFLLRLRTDSNNSNEHFRVDGIEVTGEAIVVDTDSDGVPDASDNCVNDANPGQEDNYGTSLGDACEADTFPPDLPAHVSPADGAIVDTLTIGTIDWTDVVDFSSPVTYIYQSSTSTGTELDGSFTTPAYTSAPLAVSEINAAGTPVGTYYWHVRAVDSLNNYSDWTNYWTINVVAPATCGNSVIEGGETCDDGNTDDGDGCDMMCQIEPAPMCNGFSATIYVRGNNTIAGGPDDGAVYTGTLNGTSGSDVIVGTDGDDTINGNAAGDTICAGAGHDVVDGGLGNDDIFGEDGNDSLRGGLALSDDLDGGDGIDYCRSTAGGADTEINCEETGLLKGLIVIEKDTAPDHEQDFEFTGYNNAFPLLTTVFTLDDDADGTYSNMFSGGYIAGQYTVTESVTSGWELTGLTCFDADGGSSTNVGTSTASIDLDIGEVITCTFTNEEVVAVCGNSIIEGGEQCDDGNTDNGDGCSDMCQNQALACTPVDSDLIANWKLDESAPATVADDATTNGNDGSVTDATAGVTGAPALPFYNPSAYDFDGTDDSIAMASNVGNFSLADDFTISAWINPELDFSNQAIYGNTWSNAGYLLRVNAENKVRFILVENGSVYNGMDSDVLTAGWHHVVGSWDGTDVKVFVDGVDQSVTPITNGTVTTITTSNPTHIGQTGQAGSEQFFDGSIDDVRVYDRALTDMEVSDLYAGSCDVSPVISCTPTDDYLVAYWNLDEGVGSTLTDMSTYDNGGSVNGAAWTMSGPTLAFTTPYALSFDGVDDRVTVADDTDLDFGTNDAFSAAAWMNAGPLTGNFQTIVHKIDDTTSDRNGYLLTYNEGTLEVWIIADADVNNLIRVPASAPVAIDGWHHVGFTYDGSSTAAGVRIYIDGVDMTGAPLIDALTGSILNAKPFEMGYRSDAFAQPFSGMLDDVRVYSTDLSSSEMAELSAGQCDAGVTIPVVVVVDTDTDGIEDGSDNCPLTPNADQLNTDLDSDGDACDPDDDNDTILDNVDNCSLIANADQTDNDSDGEGNVCDATPGDAPTFSGLSAPDTEGSNSARRGSGTQKFGTVVKFIFRNIFGGNDSIAPGAFGGSAATPLTDGEIDTICSIRKALPTQTSSSMLEWIAEQLAADMNRDADLIVEALKDTSLCQPSTQQARVVKPIAFQVDAAGYPVSSNPTWNKCISGKVTLADLRANLDKDEDGLARDCSDYHTGGLWYHPDLKVYFNFDRKQKTVELPKGYVVQKDQSVTLK